MNQVVSYALVGIFTFLSGVHFYWLMGGKLGLSAAVPQIDGQLAFEPAWWQVLMVAAGLLFCALLIAANSDWINLPFSSNLERIAINYLAALFTLRAIGDFKVIGFVKKSRQGLFARRDTILYTPLCVAIALSLLFVSV